MSEIAWIEADWPAPRHVRGLCTLRQGGCSEGPYASFNLAAHVGDKPASVAINRRWLKDRLALPQEPLWLNQVHGCAVAHCESPGHRQAPTADASIAHERNRVCCVLTADCLPVLFCDRAGTRVAAAHAGWRGMAAGVLEAALSTLGAAPGEILAWMGPAIGQTHFEVGDEVRAAFIAKDASASTCFKPSPSGRWLADLYGLARLVLNRCGVYRIHGGGHCTYAEADRFFSYRRDRDTGRMAALVWLD
jgi:polyphenol oxidase